MWKEGGTIQGKDSPGVLKAQCTWRKEGEDAAAGWSIRDVRAPGWDLRGLMDIPGDRCLRVLTRELSCSTPAP